MKIFWFLLVRKLRYCSYNCDLLATFKIKENATSLLEIRENENMIIFPSKFMNPRLKNIAWEIIEFIA